VPAPAAAPGLTASELRALRSMRTPAGVQAHLDAIPYSPDPGYRSPRSVLRDGRAHCFDGAVLAAAALQVLGHEPLLVDLEAVRDDDHVIAVWRSGRCWGAVAKSNCSGLRFREPVYRSIRELAMSYFELYFNTLGEKTLRRVSGPVRLSRWGSRWLTEEPVMDEIADALIAARHRDLVTSAQARRLVRADARSMQAGFLGSDPEGLYQPPPRAVGKRA
jgi:hypothetical protein